MFSVTIREKSGQVYTFHFDKPEIMIGRVKGNDVILPKQNISKRHSLVRAHGDRFIIEDLGSTNGTYVNGHRIASPVEITSEDKVYLGDFVMQFFDLGDHFAQQADGAGPMQDTPDTRDEPPLAPAELEVPRHRDAPQRDGFEEAVDAHVVGSKVIDGRDESTVAELDSMAAVARLMSARKAGVLAEEEPAIAADDPLAALSNVDARMTGPMDDLNAGFGDALSEGPDVDFSMPELDGEPPLDLLEQEVAPTLDQFDAVPAPEPFAPPQAPEPVAAEPLAPEPEPEPEPAPVPVPTSNVELAGGHYDAVAALYNAATAALSAELPHDSSLLNDAQWQAMEHRVVRFVDQAIAGNNVPGELDMAQVKRDLIYEIAGLGPLEALLDDDGIETIEINGPDQVHVFRGGERQVAEARFSCQGALVSAVERLVRATGLNLRDGATHAEGALADGTSLRVVWPPLCPNGPVLLLRKPRNVARSVDELVASGVMTATIAERLTSAVRAGRSVVVCGPQGSGRRTLVNALGLGVPDHERLVVAEAGVRMALSQPHVVRIDTSVSDHGGDPLAIALSMRPDRLLMCAESHRELVAFIRAAVSGLPPWIGSFYATSTADLLTRSQRAMLLAQPGQSPTVVADCVAATFDVLAQCERTAAGGFSVTAVAEVIDGKVVDTAAGGEASAENDAISALL